MKLIFSCFQTSITSSLQLPASKSYFQVKCLIPNSGYLSVMGRKRNFEIIESLSTLPACKSKVSGYKKAHRLTALLLIKEEKYRTLQEVADHLSIHFMTLERWISDYKELGIDKYLGEIRRNNLLF